MARKTQSKRPRPTGDSQAESFLRRHRTVSRLALAMLMPVLLIGATEGLLRVFGVGYPTDLFLRVENSDTYCMNRQFGWRFFPRKIARKPIPQSFQAHKPARTCRIFTLGASAALGVPNSAFSFSRSLEVMLSARYPGVEFEFVNTALTAINSHTVLPIARECARYEPDVYLVYLGNNEVIGPYGIGASAHGSAANLKLVRAGIALRGTRIGQLLQRLVEKQQEGAIENSEWRGMQMYSRHMVNRGDPALDVVRDNFRQNLRDISLAGTNAGANVVLSTVAVNLRDSPPFASVADSSASPAVLAHLEQLLAAAQQLIDRHEPAAARDSLVLAHELDPGYANTHYLLGEAELALGHPGQARQAFAEALEYDALRFRTDQRLNGIVRDTAADLADRGVFLADTEQIIRATDPSGAGIPGQELFYEHVHLTFQGNYLVARALLPTVEQALPAWVRDHAVASRPIPTIDDCARNLMFTAANEYLSLAQMRTTVTPYPFTAQLDHERRLQIIDDALARLRGLATPAVQRATVEGYRRAHERRPRDLLLALNFAKILSLTGNTGASNRIMRQVLASQPPAADLKAVEITQLSGGG